MMSDPLLNPPGRVNWTDNEGISHTDLNAMGDIDARSLLHVLAWFFRTPGLSPVLGYGTPQSGFPGRNCYPYQFGTSLSVYIAPGMGLYYDAAATDAFASHYKPILVSSALHLTMTTHHATLARIDSIYLKPALTTDTSASRQFIDPLTDTISAANSDTRQVWSYDYLVVDGTPGSTTAPGEQSGYIKVAEVEVPATAGTVTVTDMRPRLGLGVDFNSDPPDEYVGSGGFVPGTGNELLVAATSGTSMSVQPGESVHHTKTPLTHDGTFRHRRRSVGTITLTQHATLDKIAVVFIDRWGVIDAVYGTAASPATDVPTPGDGGVALAQVYIFSVASGSGPDVTDVRVRQPFSGEEQLQPGTVLRNALARPPILPVVTVGALVGTTRRISIQGQDGDGADVAVDDALGVAYQLEVLDNSMLSTTSTFTAITGSVTTTGTKSCVLFTGTDTLGVIDIDPAIHSTYYLKVTVLNRPGYVAFWQYTT